MSVPTEEEVRVFICYSHADRRWLERLLVHLSPLRRSYPVDVWSDREIQSGTKWRDAIRSAIERCNTAVLLVSPDFLSSEFIANDELPPLLQAADERGALIIPVIVGPCLFLRYEELAVFQAANDPAQPLLSMSEGDSETVFLEVAERIMDRVEQAEVSAAPEALPTPPPHEEFLNPKTWTRLVKIGDWVYDTGENRIVGSGTHTFLLSREEYGADSFRIEARASFSPEPAPPNQKLGFNAGFVLGWTHEKQNPRYYNILITGREILLERIGFKAQSGRSAEHLTSGQPLKIVPGQEYDFRVLVSGPSVSVEVDGVEVLQTDEGPPIAGRVGMRPWRSTLRVHQFTVGQTV